MDNESELVRLRRRVERLGSLVEVGAIISSTLDLDEVLNLVMNKARQVMVAETCSILLFDQEEKCLEFVMALGGDERTTQTLKNKVRLNLGQGVAGWCAQERKSALVADAQFDGRFYRGADELTGFVTHSLMAVPLVNKGELIGVAEVINPLDKPAFDQEDLVLFETFCRQVAIAIDNARYHKAFLAEQRLREQLKIAASIQASFLPPPLPPDGERPFRLEAVSYPALTVGGDLYDYFHLPGDRLAVFIGDVSGKGVGAALYMARVVSEFRYLARLKIDPAETVGLLNQSLSRGAEHGMFLTATFLLLDLKTGQAVFCNAGHVPGLVVKSGQDWVERLEGAANPPVGIFEDLRFVNDGLCLSPGDSLVFLTDGVIEAYRGEREEFGYERLAKVVGSVPADGSLCQAVVDSVREFTESRPNFDDLTLVHLTWLGGGPAGAALRRPAPEMARETVALEISPGPQARMVLRDVSQRMALAAGLQPEEAVAFFQALEESLARSPYFTPAPAWDGPPLKLVFSLAPDRLVVEVFGPVVVNGSPGPARILEPGEDYRLFGLEAVGQWLDEAAWVAEPEGGGHLRLTKFISDRRA